MITLKLRANLGHLLWVQTDKFHLAFYGLRTRSPVPTSRNPFWVLRKSRLYSQKAPPSATDWSIPEQRDWPQDKGALIQKGQRR